MYSTFLTASPGSVLISRSTLLKRKDLCFSCLNLGLIIRHRRIHKQQFSPVFFTAFIRHQNAAAEFLEKLLEDHQAADTDDDTQAGMASVFTALQHIATANDSAKSSLDDFGQKWKHSAAQFELYRKFARSHNPDDDSMTAGPGIYDNYKRQVNAYGETSVYKRDCGQLVPKPVAATKTDWREGSATRAATPKKQASQQQMAEAAAPPRPSAARGRGGNRPPASDPSVAVVVLP
jgi:hypothetical protein